MAGPLPRGSAVLCYDGTLEGFCCAVLTAYELRQRPAGIVAGHSQQLGLFSQLVDVPTSWERALRVRQGLEGIASGRVWRKVQVAFLSDEEGREDALFAYIELAMRSGAHVLRALGDARVAAVERLATQVLNERERMYQFLRFEQLEGGVWFGRIRPKARVVPIMMGHFAQRYNTQPFMILDEAHGMAGVSAEGRSGIVLVGEAGLDVPGRADGEVAYQRLWKRFYDSVSNDLRYNPDLRRSFMPKRLWGNLTEFARAVEDLAPAGSGA